MKIADYFYTAQEATDILGINRITIWRWIKEGKLESQKIGGVVLIPKWQVDLLKTNKECRNGNSQRVSVNR